MTDKEMISQRLNGTNVLYLYERMTTDNTPRNAGDKMIYVKERSEVTAVQYNGKNGAEIDQAFGSCRQNSSGDLWLGEYLLRIGDWAIRDCGITYTMSDSVFQKVFVPDELDWADRLTKIEELERRNMRLSDQLDEVHKAFPSHDEDPDHLPTVIERHIGERIDAAVKEAVADTLRQAQAELRSLVAGRSVQEIVVLMMASEKIGMIGNPERYSTVTDPK